ncbi:hypothetical protein F0562_024955 [Nyssa sinensis]|uniref:ATPase AAA-type core domain-containing protein n=1 Tax=Nyssa sinensis TaxID=561372 RepID=A0A5J5BGN5_9ASTE|nr:hypothetical protein F0562_024955 [Nyssa sinensis]
MFFGAIIRQYCPYEVRRFFENYTNNLMSFFNPYIRITIHQFTGSRLKCSEAYAAVEAYLSVNSSKNANRLKAEMGIDNEKMVLTMDEYEKVTDEFRGANLLNYHVYDLELTAVKDNSELKKLLIETTSKSIIVMEDIDCSLDLTGERKKKEEKPSEDEKEEVKKEISRREPKEESGSKVTLSGLLNFIDGLWSSSGGERLIVFTTNHVEKLDPALIRRGRMDKHIELSYCSFEGFKVLAKNYLRIEAHPMFDSIEQLMKETKITPADIAENLMPKSPREDAEKCLSKLIRALEEATIKAAKERADEKTEDKEPAKRDALSED